MRTKGANMKLVNTKANVSFVTGKCKNNAVPSHYLTAQKANIKIEDVKCVAYMNPERTAYTVIDMEGQWLYAKTHDLMKHKQFNVVIRKASEAK
jgi:hypothetical protein